MNETFDFKKNRTKVNYLATINEDRPSNRPFGDPILFDQKIYLLTNQQKEVSKQLSKITMLVWLPTTLLIGFALIVN